MGNDEDMRPIRTLLVEPDPSTRKYLTQQLRARGHTVKASPDGETAWRAHEKKPYDLAIVDWQLPDIDSLAFIQKIRSFSADSATIVIAIAAKEKPRDLEPLLAAGIDDFVSVPLYPPQMNIRLAIAERQIRSRSEKPRVQATARPGSKDLFPSILDMTYEGIISIDQALSIVLFNRGAERIFGYGADEVLGQPLDMLIPDQFREIHRRHVTQFAQKGPDARYMGMRPEIEGRRKDGTLFPAEASISRVEIGGEQVLTVVLRDMTARKQAEQAVERAKGITQQLLTFARGGQPIKSKLPLVPLLKESVKFALQGSSVRPKFQFEGDIWVVHIDPDQITRVINNLAINAVQAMPQGGYLHVSASNCRVDTAHRRGPLDPGHYVEVTIRDEGVGIPPDNFDKIFDPYFTTKKAGSGLGLYSCFNILTNHSGWITVSSEVEQGAAFTFYLPAVTLSAMDGDHMETIPSGSGRILVMDDDEGIRMALDKLLTRMGYEVVGAPEGEAALEAYRASQKEGRPFDVVILDLTIAGGLGGLQTFQELWELNPAIKAIVASGYLTDPVMAKYQEYGFVGILSKPFSAEELGKTLNDVLAKS